MPLQSFYLDWLVTHLRPIRVQNLPSKFLQTDYIRSEIAVDPRTFINLLQFLKYAQNLDYQIESLGGTSYRKVIFPVRDFLKFQDPSIQEINHYPLFKAKEFFEGLQTGRYLISFLDCYFQSLILVPKVNLLKCLNQRISLAEFYLVEELFYYQYPFFFSHLSQQKLSKDEVQVQFLQVFSSVTIEKEFLIKEFLDSYLSTISNQRITNVKRFFIELVETCQEYNLIKTKFKILSNNSWIETNKLNTFNISEGFIIYEKLEIL